MKLQTALPPRALVASCVALALDLALASAPAHASRGASDTFVYNGFEVANAGLPAQAIQRGGPPKDGIPAIDHPKSIRVEPQAHRLELPS